MFNDGLTTIYLTGLDWVEKLVLTCVDKLTTYHISLVWIELEDWIKPSHYCERLPQDLDGVLDERLLHNRATIDSTKSREIALNLKSSGYKL